MYPNANVKMRGAMVGSVASIQSRPNGQAAIHLATDPSQLHFIPANVLVDNLSTTGLKSEYDPLGATGVAQCMEVFEQLRGYACNQIDGARIALTHNSGGPTAVPAVTILEGPGANGE